MSRKSFLKRAPQNEQMNLQITSMADVMVIILVFLLKSYATTGIPVEVTQSLQVPQANGRPEAPQAVKMEISQSSVALDGHPVIQIRDYAFASADLDQNGSSRSLMGALSQIRKQETPSADGKPTKGAATPRPETAKILVIADHHAPYATIKAALASAALQGFTDVKLAVTSGN